MRLSRWSSLLTLTVLQVRMGSAIDFINLAGILFAVTCWLLFLIISKVRLCIRVFRVPY